MDPRPPRPSRRSLLAACGAGALGTLAGCLDRLPFGSDAPRADSGTDCSTRVPAPADADAAHWPMGGHDAGGTRHAPGVDAGAPPGDPAWTITFPESHLPTRPCVGPDRLYLCVSDHDPTPAETRVVAFGLDDGRLQWDRELAFENDATPTLAPDGDGRQTLFALSGQDNSNTGPGQGEVLALDPATGQERWRWTVDRNLGGPVVVARGTVVVHNDSSGKAAVHALDATAGEERWRFETGPVLHRAPTVAGDRAFASRDRERLVALRMADGKVAWETETRDDTTRPVVDAARGHVFVGHRRGLEAFCAGSGDRSWHLVTTAAGTPDEDLLGVTSGPVVADDVLYVWTSDTSGFAVGDLGHLYGVDPSTGEVRWTLEEGHPVRPVVSAGGTALVARQLPDEERTGSPFDPAVSDLAAVGPDGSVRWTMDGHWTPAAVADGRLLAFRGETTSVSGQVDVVRFDLG